jgi:hypothetical protein
MPIAAFACLCPSPSSVYGIVSSIIGDGIVELSQVHVAKPQVVACQDFPHPVAHLHCNHLVLSVVNVCVCMYNHLQ